ncbi:FAD-binding domain-containing protein, partial [Penicillium odoratum]|uniref:FAD-binding domain-containing protein n=1 Tax=Penicillium odoratum TaxID=1167516 RepID=UPI0025474B1A
LWGVFFFLFIRELSQGLRALTSAHAEFSGSSGGHMSNRYEWEKFGTLWGSKNIEGGVLVSHGKIYINTLTDEGGHLGPISLPSLLIARNFNFYGVQALKKSSSNFGLVTLFNIEIILSLQPFINIPVISSTPTIKTIS